MKNRYLFYPVVIVFFCLFVAACSSPQIYSFNISSRLLGGGKIIVDVDVDFENKKGPEELDGKLKEVRYAFTLVYSRKKYEDLEHQGEVKTLIVLKKILEMHLDEKPVAVRTRNYKVQPRT